MDLTAYREEVERFCQSLAEEEYLTGSGRKETAQQRLIYERHGDLFTDAAHASLREALGAAQSPAERRQLGYLVAFVVDGLIEIEVRDLEDEVTDAEIQGKITVEGREIPYRQGMIRMENEPDRGRRSAIVDAMGRLRTEVLNPLRAEIFRSIERRAAQLGYASYPELCRSVRGLPLDEVDRRMQAFVAETDELYRLHLERMLRAAGIPPAEAATHDVAYLSRSRGYDKYFPSEGAVPALKHTLREMGIDLGFQKEIVLDLEPRPGKSPRAFCAPVQIPGRIYLVTAPHGGPDDYRALFHEAGHAEHFAHFDPGLAMEDRYLGTMALTETFAFLMEDFQRNPRWCKEFLGLEDPAYQRRSDFLKLYLVRRYAAKLRYELGFYTRSSVEDNERAYRDELESALGITVPGHQYLTDVDTGFYAAEYLMAWMAEAVLRDRLKSRFGHRWWASPRAVDLLREAWRQGETITVNELLDLAGAGPLGEEALIEELKQNLSVAVP